jgi:P27 family predicted phage terminase small subunit
MTGRPRGPRPIPTHLKLLRGNAGHQKLNMNEPQPAIAPQIPEAPKFLVGYAMDEWYRINAELYHLRLLTLVDLNPLAAYCQAYATWRTAVETLATMADRDSVTHGLMVKAATGSVMQNPLVLTVRQSANDMVRFASEFGLTPAARSRISNSDDPTRPSGKFGPLLAG